MTYAIEYQVASGILIGTVEADSCSIEGSNYNFYKRQVLVHSIAREMMQEIKLVATP